MATYFGQTVDVYEDFEDALVTWVETDLSGVLDPHSASAQYPGDSGSAGMAIDMTASHTAYIRYPVGFASTPVSIGFWFYTGAYGTWANGPFIAFLGDIAELPDNLRVISISRDAGATDNLDKIVIRGNAAPVNGPLIANSTWYWITAQAVRNGTCTVRVYDTSFAQVGADVTCTGNDNAINALTLGGAPGDPTATSIYFDEYVADWTDATFPLLGWDSGISGTSVPVKSNFYRRMRAV